ncbi:hypothetical protein DK293_18410 [Vibrio cholerae]|nr:hypothetical protein [Vibrio cholerae]
MENFIKANLIRSDLVEIDRQLSGGLRHDMSTMLLVKQASLTITNLVDFELTIRLLYKNTRNFLKNTKIMLKTMISQSI